MGATSPHFSEAELRCRGAGCNIIPPLSPVRGCGENRAKKELVDGLEAYRALLVTAWTAKLRRPVAEFPGVNVHDAYRCLKHNAESGGAGKSEHVDGLAADLSVLGLTPAELEAIARKIPAIRGIGRQDDRINPVAHVKKPGYIHVDMRPTLTLARWSYDSSGKWCTYFPPPVIAS